MDLLMNDRSIHEQFHDTDSFRQALGRLLSMRNVARRFGRDVYCHHAVLSARPIPGVQIQQAIGRIADRDMQRAVVHWLTQGGPFWDDVRQHSANDWLECQGEIVTDSAVGEVAFRNLHNVSCGLVSVRESNWCFSPIEVVWRRQFVNQDVAVENWWEPSDLESRLSNAATVVRSWVHLREIAAERFRRVTFAKDCFQPLAGIPFARSSADRLLVLLDILDRLKGSFSDTGVLDAAGLQLRQDYFVGERALFTDSSNREKSRFREDLTFPHPGDSAQFLFCTWHGKERRLNLRVHFSWPIVPDEPLYVVYAGPKITRT